MRKKIPKVSQLFCVQNIYKITNWVPTKPPLICIFVNHNGPDWGKEGNRVKKSHLHFYKNDINSK